MEKSHVSLIETSSLRCEKAESHVWATAGDERRLFDVAADPAERVDVSGARPEVMRESLETYEGLRASPPSPPVTRGVDRCMDDRTRTSLRALGYLGDDD